MISSSEFPILVTDGSQCVRGNHVLVGGVSSNPSGIGLLVTNPGSDLERIHPVHLLHDPVLPKVLVIDGALSTRCGIASRDGVRWEIRPTIAQVAESIDLELVLDVPAETAAARLSSSNNLDGQIVHFPHGTSCNSVTINIDGAPYKIRSIHPGISDCSTFVISAARTTLSLFAPNHRAGVDVVILADTSGSMSTDDLTTEQAVGDPTPVSFFQSLIKSFHSVRRISRIQAVRNALLQLLENRYHSQGSCSRLALVRFDTASKLVFPNDGMVEVDSNTPESTYRQFKDRIATLTPSGGTNIAQALQFAATHLSNHGRPGNLRLVVLLSDGADWTPKREDSTGEMLDTALEDPVSLMEHLHRAMDIHLHAVGISDEGVFQSYLREKGYGNSRGVHTGLAPNHELLKQLLAVGGGDTQRIGDASVLDDYFRGLGAGVTQQVRITKRWNSNEVLSDTERSAIISQLSSRAAVTQSIMQADGDLRRLCTELKAIYRKVSSKAPVIVNFFIWVTDFENTEKRFEYLSRPIFDERSFGTFATDLHILITDNLKPDIKKSKETKEENPGREAIAAFMHKSETIKSLAMLRHKYGAHGTVYNSTQASSSSASDVGNAIQYFVGYRHIDEGDAAGWDKLRKVILEKTLVLLNELDSLLEGFNRPKEETSAEKIVAEW
jgi:hypothetical protein